MRAMLHNLDAAIAGKARSYRCVAAKAILPRYLVSETILLVEIQLPSVRLYVVAQDIRCILAATTFEIAMLGR